VKFRLAFIIRIFEVIHRYSSNSIAGFMNLVSVFTKAQQLVAEMGDL